MKNRILTGWTFIRVFQLVLGSIVIVQSVADKQWFGVLFGSYFAAMGLFAFGCAAGNCQVPTKPKTNPMIVDVEFEEVKIK